MPKKRRDSMKCSRRNFLAGSGALILTTGVAGTSVVSSS
ncbi:twin-arginine translocation signal domain-containing protein, partial [Vibrio parahaemolyticus]|nr:twin-arginine translocation signal domain-containing protein [Vibrio parahaemolyticus]